MTDIQLSLPNRVHSPLQTIKSLAQVWQGRALLRLGSRGDAVAIVQQALHGIAARMPISMNRGRGPADGIFGPETLAVVRGFQSATGLAADGIVGPKTLAKLDQMATVCGLSQLITLGHALIRSVDGERVVNCSSDVAWSRGKLEDELRPFDRGLWDDAYLSAFIRRTEAQIGGDLRSTPSATTLASAVPLPIPHPAILVAFAIGVIAIQVITTSKAPPKLPDLPRQPPLTPGVAELATGAVGLIIAQIKLQAKAAQDLAKTWKEWIEDYKQFEDPNCMRAVAKAAIAVNELFQRALSAPHAIRPGSLPRQLTTVLEGLLEKIDNARNAVFEMLKACPLP
jgi:hypothetical protein